MPISKLFSCHPKVLQRGPGGVTELGKIDGEFSEQEPSGPGLAPALDSLDLRRRFLLMLLQALGRTAGTQAFPHLPTVTATPGAC